MDIKQSIVGIFAEADSAAKFNGTGFLVEGNLLLTCAHVVGSDKKVGDVVFFQFEGQAAILSATIDFYSPEDALDIAILKPNSLSKGVVPLRLAESKTSRGHKFSAFGYPQKGNFVGLYGIGEILGLVTEKGRAALQLSSSQLTYGYSGGPVWDETLQRVVGMVRGGLEKHLDLSDKLGDAVFAVPTETLKAVYPALTLQAAATGWHFSHHYGDRPNFTGRQAEREMLTAWLTGKDHTLFVLRALGGFGKSALAWHWLRNEVAPADFPKAVWWSFYEGDASFENFLQETLEYLGVAEAKTLNPRQQVSVLLGKLQDAGILLVLDGFERALRAFSGLGAAYQGDPAEDGGQTPEDEARGRDCVSPAAEDFLRGLTDPRLRGKVLMTTRLCPHVLAGHDRDFQARCHEVQLKALQPADAYIFMTEKEKIKATRAEVEAACAPYDYHPLSLNLLAGLIKKDFEYPRDIRAAQKYLLSEIKNHKEHILKAAYETLPADRQQLLSKIACFRGSLTYETLKTVFTPDHLDQALNDLQERGLLQTATPHPQITNPQLPLTNPQVPLTNPHLPITTPQPPTFDLHPIVRRYAYERLTGPDRAAAHTRLAGYFEAVPKPQKIEILNDLAPVIELYHHMVRAGKFDEALDLYDKRLSRAVYFQFGAYQTSIELLTALFPDGENKPPRLKKESAQAWTLNTLANAYALSGQPRRAVPLFLASNVPDEKSGNKKGVAIGLGNVASMAQIHIGALAGAERNLRRSIVLGREIEDEFQEAVGHQNLGRLLSYRGLWLEAEQELDAGLKLFEKQQAVQSQGIIWAYRALRHLLLARANPQSTIPNGHAVQNQKSAIDCARRALELAEGGDPNIGGGIVQRDVIRAKWLLGAAYRASSDLSQAETHLGEALRRCRAINMVDHEAYILLELAKLSFDYGLRAKNSPTSSAQEAQKYFDESLRLAGEALVITERSGYALQGADVHLWLAVLALEGLKLAGEKEMSNEACALRHAQQAKQLATGWEGDWENRVYDTTGEVVYRVAYDEAKALIERMRAEG